MYIYNPNIVERTKENMQKKRRKRKVNGRGVKCIFKPNIKPERPNNNLVSIGHHLFHFY